MNSASLMNSVPPAPPPLKRLKCFDVSHYQPDVYWKQALASGERVCMSKFTDGTEYVDPTAAQDRIEAVANGMVYMPYHFFRFDPDPAQQAAHLMHALQGVHVGELAPCLDLEWDNSSQNMQYHDSNHGAHGTQGQLDEVGAQRALTFLHTLESLSGVTPFVYTSPGFFPGLVKPETLAQFARYPLWVANYGVAEPRVPHPWKTWTFWQFSSTEPVPGVGKIDASWFNGDETALKALVKK